MNSLFTDIYVYQKSRSLIIIALISFLIIFGIPLYLILLEDTLPKAWKVMLEGAFEFPTIYNTIAVIQYYLNFMICVMMINMVTSRLETRTFKLSIINGVLKRQIFINTLLLSAFVSSVLLLASIVNSTIIGLYKDPSGFTVTGMYWLFIYGYQSLVLLSFSVTFSLIFKHAGTAGFAFVLWFFILERVFAQILDFNFKFYPIFRFLPGKSLEDISYMIITKGMVVQHLEYHKYFFTASGIWLAISLIINYTLIIKHDYVK